MYNIIISDRKTQKSPFPRMRKQVHHGKKQRKQSETTPKKPENLHDFGGGGKITTTQKSQ